MLDAGMPGSPEEACGEIKPFLLKAYALVGDPATDAIISWAPSGDHFIVHNTEAFASQVLPSNFKHNNFSSFIRQLNTYGFRKVETDKWSFGHDCFKRGQPQLLAQIQRKRGGTSGRARAGGGAGGGGGGGTVGTEGEEEVDFLESSLTALMPHGMPALASPTAAAAGARGARAGAADARRAGAAGGGAAAAAERGGDVTAPQVLAEIMRMSQQQAEMLAEVKRLQADLHQTREAQHLTRETIGKVVGFLQHLHGGGGAQQPAGDGGVYLQGPGLDSPLPPAKRTRLQLTNSTRDFVDLDISLLDELGGASALPVPPRAAAAAAAAAGTSEPPPPLFTPETLAISRQMSQQLSKAAGDEVEIDIESVLDLLNGIEKELPPGEAQALQSPQHAQLPPLAGAVPELLHAPALT